MRYLYICLIVVIALSLMFYDDLNTVKFSGVYSISNIFKNVFPGEDLRERVTVLQTENESLRAEIIGFKINHEGEVKVYSSYPFNNKKDVSISGGLNLGFKKGDAVTVNSKILVGQISEVLSNSSIVKTVYDPDWEIAVRIGEKEIDGLLKGGLSPVIDFIKSDAEVVAGDIILTASPDLPYGLEIGKIKSVKDNPGSPFKTAEIEFAISLNSLRDVSVYR